jgi:hypothetical protein
VYQETIESRQLAANRALTRGLLIDEPAEDRLAIVVIY